jgi:hypothetical protein
MMLDRLQHIVTESKRLKDSFTDQPNAPVNYVCIFAQSDSDYQAMFDLIPSIGEVIESTETGPLIQIYPLPTIGGPLELFKLRKHDPGAREEGAADFTVSDYQNFKRKYLIFQGFTDITSANFEMIELRNDAYTALTYFSYPPLAEQLGIE